MRRDRLVLGACALFAAGAAIGAWAAKKVVVERSVYANKPPAEAGAALLAAARELAGQGTYERIAVGRVLYLSGSKSEGKALFDAVLAGKHDTGDVIRVARVYQEAGEWEQALPLFERVLAEKPKDEDWLAEIAAYHLIAGDRTGAEELFARSLAEDPSNLYNTLRFASGLLGLRTMP